jgi:2-iminoacetate synthase
MPKMDLSDGAVDFINDASIQELISGPRPDRMRVRDVLARSLAKQALSVEEAAVLVRADEPALIEEIFEGARELKQRVYGNRIVLFAPVYIGNSCTNDCAYCAFRRSNQSVVRRTLATDEIRAQVEALERQGHKRLVLVFGEAPSYDAGFIQECVKTVYQVRVDHGSIRRVNINAAPLEVNGFRRVRQAGIGTYQILHETYHHETYRRCHPANTRKGDYLYRLDALDRAQEAGLDDVGLGSLFGLYDWRFEVLGLVTHALHLQDRFNVGPHTISFPRLQPARGVSLDERWLVSDSDIKRVIAILRLAVPYAGLILTSGEDAGLRREVMSLGVSQIDAGSWLEVGGYTEFGDSPGQHLDRAQFKLGDVRPVDEVVRALLVDGYIPSFCTACYRLGRTGEHFMEFAAPGFIRRFCTPNAMTTLMEYVVDHASPETRAAGEKMIREEVAKIESDSLKKELLSRLDRIRTTDDRDLPF